MGKEEALEDLLKAIEATNDPDKRALLILLYKLSEDVEILTDKLCRMEETISGPLDIYKKLKGGLVFFDFTLSMMARLFKIGSAIVAVFLALVGTVAAGGLLVAGNATSAKSMLVFILDFIKLASPK